MYTHFGKTLKIVAAVLTGFFCLLFLFIGVFTLSKGGDLFYTGLEIILFGVIGSWLSFLVLYGLGELIDQAQRGADAGEQLVRLITRKDEEKTPEDYDAMEKEIMAELQNSNYETLNL